MGKILVELGVVKSETAEDDSAEELVFKEAGGPSDVAVLGGACDKDIRTVATAV